MSYHATVRDVYRRAAEEPDDTLCCVPQPPRYLPGLVVPGIMHAMNYGCGTTVHLQDMTRDQSVAYVGVGGGLEALELAYFTRRPGGVIAIDPVPEMREKARVNLELAAELNDWFDPAFVEIRDGDALDLPLDDESVDLAAQNCLFNIFKTAAPDPGLNGHGGAPTNGSDANESGDLERALSEMHRVLTNGGRLVMSDPITPRPIPMHLQVDEVLRAQCISGCLTYAEYVRRIVEAGFGSAEIRSRKPYRLLDHVRYHLDDDLLLETIEIACFKVPVPEDGACIFTGRTAVYAGEEASFDDGKGHVLPRGLPMPVCDKTAGALAALDRADLVLTGPTWHHHGGGCC